VRDAARRFALGAGQAMLVHEIAHQPARVDRHRAVEEDRDVAEASLRAQTREMIEKRLNPSHGEGRENTGNKRGHGSAGSTGLKMGQSC
jgi:hypothetical protein